MKLSLTFLIGILSWTHCISQEKILSGKITQFSGTPIPGATILLSEKNTKVSLGYAIANNLGEYKINFQSSESLLWIEISMIGFKPIKDSIIFQNNRTYTFQMTETSVELNTVVVKANTLEDTMKIQTENMVLNERSTLKEILNQSDGFIVSEDGSISFRGKPINKILINNKEVFIHQNKIALENLEHGIMDNLELINNYKDKFNIDFNNFKESILNINTKDQFKGVVKYKIDAGVGVKEKYIGKLKGFYFSDKLNSFLINNINNIGQKEFSWNDVPNLLKESNSSIFKTRANYFFLENGLTKSAFDWNNSLTIRKEGDDYRLGIIINYLQSKQSTESELYSSFTHDQQKVKSEFNTLNQSGRMIIGNLNLSKLLNTKTSLNIQSSIGLNKLNTINITQIENYLGDQAIIRENNGEQFKNIQYDFSVSIHQLLKRSIKATFGAYMQYESSHPQKHVQYEPPIHLIDQKIQLNRNGYKVFTSFEKRYHYLLAIGVGASIQHNIESVFFQRNSINRNYSLYEPHIVVRGKNYKWEYSTQITPQFYQFREKQSNIQTAPPKMEFFINFKPSGNKDLWFNFSQSNEILDLLYAVDTLLVSYNYRITNPQFYRDNIGTSTSGQLGFYHSNITRLEQYGLSVSLGKQRKYLEAVYNDVVDNVFYYRNWLIPEKDFYQIDFNVGKGYYIQPDYHKISISGKISYLGSKFQTYSQQSFLPFTTKGIQYHANASFEPQQWKIDRISLQTRWGRDVLFLENSKINTQQSFRITGSIARKKNEFEFELLGGLLIYKNIDTEFTTPLLNINSLYAINTKWQVFIRSQNLIHLFNITGIQYTGLNIRSEGNFVHQQINKFNLNYFIVGMIYKP